MAADFTTNASHIVASNTTAMVFELLLHSLNESAKNPNCVYERYSQLGVKFTILVIVVPILAIYGIVGSSLAIYVYSRPGQRSANGAFLSALAVCDIGVLSTAVFLYSIEIIFDYYLIFWLYEAWLSYLRLVYVVSHICQVGAIYMTIAATVERCFEVLEIRCCRREERICERFKTALVWICAVTIFVVTITVTKYFEIEMVTFEHCTGFSRYQLRPSALAQNNIYKSIHTIWVSVVFVVVLPFFLLLALNLVITVKEYGDWRSGGSGEGECLNVNSNIWMKHFEQRARKRRRREANIILVVIVAIFLVCNLPDLLLTIIEELDYSLLVEHRDFYSLMKDAINVLSVLNSAANFTVYVIFGREFRKELRKLFRCR